MFTFARSAGTKASIARSWTIARIPATRSAVRTCRGLPQLNTVAPWSASFNTTAARLTADDLTKKGKDSVYVPPSAGDMATHGDTATDQERDADQISQDVTLTSDATEDIVSCTVSPPSTEAFLKPTPVVLLTGPFGGNWCFRDTWQATLADQGYQSTSIELAMPSTPLESGDAYIRHFVKLLKTSIETDHSFFPPILIAHGFHALVAEKYVESNPVSALVLVSPFIPSVVKDRLMTLAALGETEDMEDGENDEQQDKNDTRDHDELTTSQDALKATVTGASSAATALGLQQIKTHADLLKIPGFKSRFVMPAKAVYKVDRIAKEAEEKEKAVNDVAPPEKAIPAAGSAVTEGEEKEQLGHDSVPVVDKGDLMGSEPASTPHGSNGAIPPPEQIVESEASMPSPLEQLPLSVYDTIETSIYEPTFPILLLTSQGDTIVSTSDVEEYHHLAGEVDHVELGDDGDGGHMIMVGDNAEWEEGIMGITAWLDTNGM